MAPTMPSKTGKNSQNCGNGDKSSKTKSKLACILEASESARLRVRASLPNHHEDILQEKETIHYGIKIWFTNLFLCLKL